MPETSKHLTGPWVAVLSHRGDVFDSLDEAASCGIEEVDIQVVRGTAAPMDGAFPHGSTLVGDELYELSDVWIGDEDESVGAAARWEQAQAVAAALNAVGNEEVERLRAELDAIGDLAYRFSAFDAGYMVREFTAEIQSRAKRAAGGA